MTGTMPQTRLLGPDGRPIARRDLTTPIAVPTTTGARPVTSADPAAGLTPARLAALMRTAERGDPMTYLELAERMEERDLHYRAVLGTRKQQVAQLDVQVDAASDAPDDVRAADLVRDWIGRDGLADELMDVLDGIGKGFSVCEILWETSASEWRPKLEWRDPRWFRFDLTDLRTILLRTEGAGGTPLPPWKFLTHVHRTKSGLPVRGGLAWAVGWTYLFKVYSLKDWVGFAERYGQPMRVGKYGPGASEADRETLMQAVVGLGADAAAVVPDGMIIELIEAKGLTGSADVYERLCAYLDQQVSKLVLGQTTTTDAISGGHAVSREHQQVREDIERSDARQLARTLNEQLVRPLVDLNMGPRAAYPTIRIGRAEEEDLDAMADRLVKLVPLGLRVGESEVRDRLGFPDPGEEERTLGAAPPAPDPTADPAAPPDPPPPPPGPAEATATAAAAAERDAIDDAVDRLLADHVPLVDRAVADVLAMARAATSFEDFRMRLATLRLPGEDVTVPLARATFAAAVAGRLGVRVDGDPLPPPGTDGGV